MDIAEVLLRFVGDSSGGAEAAREEAAALDEVSGSADATNARLAETSASSDRAGQSMREAGGRARELGGGLDEAGGHSARLSENVDRVGLSTRAARGEIEGATSSLRAHGQEADNAGRAARDLEGDAHSLAGGFRDVESGAARGEKAIGVAGHALTLLGVSAGDGERGMKGVLLAADGATTGFGTFAPVIGAVIGHLSIFTSLAGALMPVLVGLGLVFSPLIAAVGSFTVGLTAAIGVFTVALAGALAVMAVGMGVLGGLGIGMVLLAAKTNELQGPLQNLQKTWKGVADTLGKEAAPAAAQILGWLNQFAPAIQKMGTEAIGWFNQRLPATLLFFQGFVDRLLDAFRRLGAIFGQVADFMLSRGSQFQSLWSMALNVVVGAVQGLMQNLERLSDWFMGNLPRFAPLMHSVFGTMGQAVQNLSAELVKLANWFLSNLPALSAVTGTTFGAIGHVLEYAAKLVGALGVTFGIFFNNLQHGRTAADSLANTFHALGIPMDKAEVLAGNISAAVGTLASIIKGAVSVLESFGAAFAKTFASSYASAQFGQTVQQIAGAIDRFLGTLQKVAPAVGSAAATIASSNMFVPFVAALPHIIDLANTLLQHLTPAIQGLSGMLQRIYPVLIALGAAFVLFKTYVAISGVIDGVSTSIRTMSEAMAAAQAVQKGEITTQEASLALSERGAAANALFRASQIAKAVATGVATAAAGAQNITTEEGSAAAGQGLIVQAAYRVGLIAGTIATWAATAAQWAWNIAMDANPIGLIILGIAALIAIVVLLVTHWHQITDAVGRAWQAFSNTGPMRALIGLFNQIKEAVVEFASRVGEFLGQVRSHFEALPGPVRVAIGLIAAILLWPLIPIVALIAGIVLLATHWQQVMDTLRNAASTVLNWVRSNWPLLLGILTGPLGLVVILIVQHWEQIKQTFQAALTFIENFVRQHWQQILFFIPGLQLLALIVAITTHWNQIRDLFQQGLTAVRNLVTQHLQAIESWVVLWLMRILGWWNNNLLEPLKHFVDAAHLWIYQNVVQRLQQLEQWAVSWIQRILGWWNNTLLEPLKHLVDAAHQWIYQNITIRLILLEDFVMLWIARAQAYWNAFLELLKRLIDAAHQWIYQNITVRLQLLEQFVLLWIGRAQAYWNVFLELLKHLIDAAHQWIYQNIVQRLQQLESWVTDWIQRGRDMWNSFLETLKRLVSEAYTWIHQTISDWLSKIESMVNSWRDRVVNTFTDLKDKIGNLASQIAQTLKDNFKKGVQDILTVLSHFFGALANLPGLGSFAGGWNSAVQAAYGDVGKLEQGGYVETDGAVLRERGGVTAGPTILVGEGGGDETVIPHEPRYRDRALALWNITGQKIGAFSQGAASLAVDAVDVMQQGGQIALQAGAQIGAQGGQCVVFVEAITGKHFNVALAKEMCAMVNSKDAKGGELAVFSGGPAGHVAMVTGGDTNNFSVIDSNWGEDEKIQAHNMNPGMYGFCGFIDLGLSLGSLAGMVGGALENAASHILDLMKGPEQAAQKEMAGLGGWPGAMGSDILGKVIGGVEDFVKTHFTGSSGGTGPTGGTKGNVSSDQLQQYMNQVGWHPAGGLATALCIAQHESGMNSGAIGPAWNGDGGSIGLFQIQPGAHPEFNKGQLSDPLYNVWSAMQVYNSSGGWGPWSTHGSCGAEAGAFIKSMGNGDIIGAMQHAVNATILARAQAGMAFSGHGRGCGPGGCPGGSCGGGGGIGAGPMTPWAQAAEQSTPYAGTTAGWIPEPGFANRRPGMMNRAAGGGIPVFDNGGVLMPGINVISNNTGAPEPMAPTGAGDDLMADLVAQVQYTNQLLQRILGANPVNGSAASRRFA